MGSDLCREILTKEWRQDKHKNWKILTHFDLCKRNENRQSEKISKNIWRKFARVLSVKIFANKHIIFTFAESENGYKANNVRVPYYAKKKEGVGVPCGLDAQHKFFSDFQSHFYQTYRLIQPHTKPTIWLVTLIILLKISLQNPPNSTQSIILTSP